MESSQSTFSQQKIPLTINVYQTSRRRNADVRMYNICTLICRMKSDLLVFVFPSALYGAEARSETPLAKGRSSSQ